MHEKAASLQLEAKTKILDSITENLELIEPHQAFFILKNACYSNTHIFWKVPLVSRSLAKCRNLIKL